MIDSGSPTVGAETVASIIRTIFAQPASMNATVKVIDEVGILPELAAA